jgi:hypothetical protein
MFADTCRKKDEMRSLTSQKDQAVENLGMLYRRRWGQSWRRQMRKTRAMRKATDSHMHFDWQATGDGLHSAAHIEVT